MKKSIITIVAFMLLALAGFAQEKYEYKTMMYNHVIYIPFTKNTCYGWGRHPDSHNLEKAQQLLTVSRELDIKIKEGWVIANATTVGPNAEYSRYLLKRKVN